MADWMVTTRQSAESWMVMDRAEKRALLEATTDMHRRQQEAMRRGR